MVEIKESKPEELWKLKEIASQVKYGTYSKSAQKMTVIQDGEIVGCVQCRPVIFIENIFLDQKLSLVQRTFLMIKIVKMLAKMSMNFVWTSYRWADKKKTRRNEFLYKLYHTFGRKYDLRQKDMWYRF